MEQATNTSRFQIKSAFQKSFLSYLLLQFAKKVVFDSPGLLDFAVGLVVFVLNLPDGQLLFLGNSNYKRIVINPANQKGFNDLWA